MRRFAISLGLFVVCAGAAFGQFTIDTYENSSSDGTYLYATGVVQYVPSYGCSMCASANHSYTQTVTIRSQSGGSGGYNQCYLQTSASNAENLQCEAIATIDPNAGLYTIEDDPVAICSEIGTFLNTKLIDYIAIAISFTQTTPWPMLGPTCPQTPACLPGTTSRCSPTEVITLPGNVCYNYYQTWLVMVNGSCLPIGSSVAADGPGTCH